MKFDNLIQGNENKLQLFSAMRKMLLSKESSPLNPSLFFDQFFDFEKLTALEKQKILDATSVWEDVADRHIVFVDSGISDKTFNKLIKLESEGKSISYDFLSPRTNSRLLGLVNLSVGDAKYFLNQYLPNPDTENQLELILKRDSLKYPSHLPTHFHTYFQHNNGNTTKETKKPIRCIIESPFAGDIESNVAYAAEVIKNLVLNKNYSPMASHLLYTRMLDDDNQDERTIGIDAGLNYGLHAEETIICVDRGLSTGMKYGIINAEKNGRKYSFFTLSNDPNIKKEISELYSVEDLEKWSKSKMKENKELYTSTGYLTPLDKTKIKSKLKIKA
jgi:hypothetical protein